jgi:hypothetical protein
MRAHGERTKSECATHLREGASGPPAGVAEKVAALAEALVVGGHPRLESGHVRGREPHRVLEVGVCACPEQQLGHPHVPLLGGVVERGAAVRVLGVGRPARQQQLRRLRAHQSDRRVARARQVAGAPFAVVVRVQESERTTRAARHPPANTHTHAHTHTHTHTRMWFSRRGPPPHKHSQQRQPHALQSSGCFGRSSRRAPSPAAPWAPLASPTHTHHLRTRITYALAHLHFCTTDNCTFAQLQIRTFTQLRIRTRRCRLRQTENREGQQLKGRGRQGMGN